MSANRTKRGNDMRAMAVIAVMAAVLMMAGCEGDKVTNFNIEGDQNYNNGSGEQGVGNTATESTSTTETEIEDSDSSTIN